MSVIYILWLRELRRYVRSRAQVVASLGQPILYLVALGFGLGPIFERAGQGSYVQFVAPGIIAMTVLFSSVFSGMGLLWDRQFGFLKETLVAPVPRIQVMLGRTLGAATVAMCQGLLVAVVSAIAGFRIVDARMLPLAFVFLALIACVFAALGTAIGSALENMQGFQMIMNFLVMPIFFLSGALFPLTNLPGADGGGYHPRSARLRGGRTARHAHRHLPFRYGARCRRSRSRCHGVSLVWQPVIFEDSGLKMPRTRSASAHRKVLDAAIQLIAGQGVDATSMDAIAHRSGVSKATIYKHWSDKDALLLEILSDINGLFSRPCFDTGDTRGDMVAVLAYRPPEESGMRQQIMPHLVAYSARNVEFGKSWRNRVMEPPRTELKTLMAKGVAKGELRPDLDFELSLALLIGPILYWYVFLRRSDENPATLAEGVVDSFWRAFGTSTRPGRTSRPRLHPEQPRDTLPRSGPR